jgi:hypothetical protein
VADYSAAAGDSVIGSDRNANFWRNKPHFSSFSPQTAIPRRFLLQSLDLLISPAISACNGSAVGPSPFPKSLAEVAGLIRNPYSVRLHCPPRLRSLRAPAAVRRTSLSTIFLQTVLSLI